MMTMYRSIVGAQGSMSFFKIEANVCESLRVWNFSLLNWFPKEYCQGSGKLKCIFFEDHWMYLVRTHRFALPKTFQVFSYLKFVDLCKFSFCSNIHIIPFFKFWKWIWGLLNKDWLEMDVYPSRKKREEKRRFFPFDF